MFLQLACILHHIRSSFIHAQPRIERGTDMYKVLHTCINSQLTGMPLQLFELGTDTRAS